MQTDIVQTFSLGYIIEADIVILVSADDKCSVTPLHHTHFEHGSSDDENMEMRTRYSIHVRYPSSSTEVTLPELFSAGLLSATLLSTKPVST